MHTLLGHGHFLGRPSHARRAGGFAFSELVPTVPEEEVHAHTHPEAHFVLIREGTYVSSAQGAPALGGAGLLIYNPPGTTHRDRFRGAGGRFFTVSIPVGELARVRDALVLPDRPVALAADSLELAARLAAQTREGLDASRLELESLTVALLDSVSRHARRGLGAVPPWLLAARELLYEEACGDHGLTPVARAVGVHPVHLVRSFRGHFGLTPGAYLRRERLNRAAALLRAARLPLVEVAQRCGYHDQAHFCRSFKRAFGLTPSAYRARLLA